MNRNISIIQQNFDIDIISSRIDIFQKTKNIFSFNYIFKINGKLLVHKIILFKGSQK